MSISEYFKWYILYVPLAVYGWGLGTFLFVLIVAILWKGKRNGVRYGSVFLLVEYIALLLYFTVLMWRSTGEYEYRPIPFWSYKEVITGTRVLLQEIAMNIVVFVPIGFLAGIAWKKATWKKALLIGLSISLTIEMLQLLLKRGCCETDDVINNTLGCMVGYGVLLLMVKVKEMVTVKYL